jgi:UDP-glucose 4-epimerase
MKQAEVSRLIYSSSAGVYGTPEKLPVTEDSPCKPLSPYAKSKLMVEQVIESSVQANEPKFPLQAMSLRYFNVVGTAIRGLSDTSPFNLFPIIMRNYLVGDTPLVTGNTFETPDGTAVRDYIHVGDVSSAHVAAARELESKNFSYEVFNISTSQGISVLQIMQEFEKRIGADFKFAYADKRPGDPASIYGDAAKASKLLNWQAKYTLADMVGSVTHPESVTV